MLRAWGVSLPPFLALVFPAAAIVGKRGLRIYPENAAQA